MMKRLKDVLNNKEDNYILPFFWQHGEDEDTLREYMEHIHKAGIKAVCVEARPHPDFLGPLWWRDIDIIMEEARTRSMKVWILDDSHFPTGYAAGKIKEKFPELKKWYLDIKCHDFVGPFKDASLLLKWDGASFTLSGGPQLGDNKVLAVVAAKRIDGDDKAIEADTLVDLSKNVKDGILYWDIPEGVWSVFTLLQTRNGGEKSTEDYLNPLVSEATRVLIDTVYEAHYEHYKEDFGNTFAGFFSDEPRLGNIKGFDASIGRQKMVLPWREDMIEIMEEEIGEEALKYLPLLFIEAGDKANSIRYSYMNIVSKLYGENFTNQIGNWCREHGVEYIGHVIEDNNAHGRLGYGAGHFYRSLWGQDMSGLDVVLAQILPGMDKGRYSSFTASGWDGEFFHYGLAKMGSSLGHIDPKKKGRTMCEVFGAYGWAEGLKLMKWITDHMLVRGVNHFVPHAFSPKKFPDADCPPHFYAGGADPQYRYLKILSDYTNRVSHLLSEGKHVAPVAVLYHAEAEWSGEYMLFQKPVKELMQNQIDCDIVPGDILKGNLLVNDNNLVVNEEKFKCLVVPYAEALPEYLLIKISELLEKGLKVVFIDKFPSRSSEGQDVASLINKIKNSFNCRVVELKNLVNCIKENGFNEIALESHEPYLRYYHYQHNNEDVFMFFNEDPYKSISSTVNIPLKGNVVSYDAFENKVSELIVEEIENGVKVPVNLSAYESTIIVFTKNTTGIEVIDNSYVEIKEVRKDEIVGKWKASFATSKEYPEFNNEIEFETSENLAKPDLFPRFSGTVKYEIDFNVQDLNTKSILDLGQAYEIAEVWLNDENIGVKICPPYRFDVSKYVKKGINRLKIEVTNTLVKEQQDFISQFLIQEPTGLIGPVNITFLDEGQK